MDWFLDHAGLVGLLFFFSIFVGVAVWLYLPRMKDRIESHAHIPFKEDHHG